MARFTSTTFGKISGKYGNAVAAVRKDGLCILKEYRVASNPNTAGQKNQRGKFGFVMKEINCLRSVFTRNFGGQYGINKVVAIAMKTAVGGEFPDFSFDYSKLKIADGNLYSTSFMSFENINDTLLRVNWGVELWGESANSDKVSIVILHSKTKFVKLSFDCAIRSDGKVDIEVPSGWVDENLKTWIYFSTADGKRLSESIFACL
jgi:Family of unknown function (DUF6266)